jgi:fatty-acyl-CoA synthase
VATSKHNQYWPAHLPFHLTLPETSVSYNLEVSATRFGAKPCLLFYGTSITYSQLRSEVNRLAGWLQQQGVRKGDRVLLNLQNSPQFVIAYYAILRVDAVVVPVNPMNRTHEFQHILVDSGADLVITGQDVWEVVDGVPKDAVRRVLVVTYSDYLDRGSSERAPHFIGESRREIDDARVTYWSDALAVNARPGPSVAGPGDPALIVYTSGTTGAPKGALHNHRSLMSTIIGAAVWSPIPPDDVVLGVLPLFHVTGMQWCMNAPLYAGATIVLLPRWNAMEAGRLIAEHRVTGWNAITTMVVDFLNSEAASSYDLSSLRKLGGGGAAMPAAIAKRLEEMGLIYTEGYGLTETMAQTHCNPREHAKRQCLGIPHFDVESLVIDPETLRELPQGEVGEIVSRGPQIFQGYWNNPQATAAAFVEIGGQRYFRTGDLGRIDEDGYFFMVDRLKRMINASGFKVWPAEVETIMYGHPAIKEVCVVAAKDAYRGETVKAVVVLRPEFRDSTSEEGIIAWAREQMAAYKVPHLVSFVDALPRSGTGKILWRTLQET